MTLKKGEFVLIDYIAKVNETGEVFDTTIEDAAKKENLYKEDELYEPKLVVVGEGWLLKKLDEGLPAMKVNKPATIEISPEEAFGNRDPQKVRLVPLRRLTAKGITPQLGKRIEFNGKLATVRTIGAGRVQLDFNPPLAGKTLVYDVTIRSKLETKAEKIKALIHRRIPAADIKKFSLRTRKTIVEIGVPEEAFYVEGLQLAKRGMASDIQRFFPETSKVRFVESFEKQEPGPPTMTKPKAS